MVVLSNCTAAIAAQSEAMKAHSKISDLLKRNEISRISVIHVPINLETRTRIDQEALRHLSFIELSFTKPREAGIIEPLQTALEELKKGIPSPVHEVRWGILFLDGSGKERASMFLDPSGQFIQIGDTNWQVQGKTLAWIQKSIHDALR